MQAWIKTTGFLGNWLRPLLSNRGLSALQGEVPQRAIHQSAWVPVFVCLTSGWKGHTEDVARHLDLVLVESCARAADMVRSEARRSKGLGLEDAGAVTIQRGEREEWNAAHLVRKEGAREIRDDANLPCPARGFLPSSPDAAESHDDEQAARMTSDGRVLAEKPLDGQVDSLSSSRSAATESNPRSGISGIVMGSSTHPIR
ncbi:hypothetical protein CMUS01_05095 [Colletotrichum musicola]|uniref:Uncharacterized protein n=1 Tax=Colletotrichum musicola TaxID=2175873 RepID=A0A8H6KTG8_9PEZI|nr:hypothetical protein CMUS01_05095 [Colletotrichum musicola]